MNCPNCHTFCNVSDHFCYLCGTPLRQAAPPKPKKGSFWIPALILIAMSVSGIALFFATAGKDAPIRSEGSSNWFYVRDGVLYFEEHRYTGGSELTVPDTIAGQPVRALSEDCFADCTELVTVHLPDTLIAIGESAFSGCTSLRGISVPESVESIGENAFFGCSALEAISIPSTLYVIGEDAFDGCDYLHYIFYDGTFDSWSALYSEFINPYTGIFCEDGSFYQGGDLYE